MFGMELTVGRVLILLAIGVGIYGAGAASGAAVNGWRLSSGFEKQLGEERAKTVAAVNEKHELELKVKDQNASIQLLGAATDAAKRAQTLAEKNLAVTLAANVKRSKAADGIQALNCGQMLEDLKRLGQ